MRYTKVILTACLLVTAPAMSACQTGSAPLSQDEQFTVDQYKAIEEAALAEAAKYEPGTLPYMASMDKARKAHEAIIRVETEAAKTFFDDILGFIPLPEPLKKPLAVLGATLVFPRPREIYFEALKGVGRSAVEITPGIKGGMSPVEAVKELGNAAKGILAGVGLLDRHPKPDEATISEPDTTA